MFFGFKKAKINFMKKIKVLSKGFMITNLLAELKNHQTLEILLMSDFFFDFFKKTHFLLF